MKIHKTVWESTKKNDTFNGKKFEYYIDYDLSTDKLNELGVKGWELVSTVAFICDGENTIKFFFKRELI